jgi:hypothetical protein
MDGCDGALSLPGGIVLSPPPATVVDLGEESVSAV